MEKRTKEDSYPHTLMVIAVFLAHIVLQYVQSGMPVSEISPEKSQQAQKVFDQWGVSACKVNSERLLLLDLNLREENVWLSSKFNMGCFKMELL